MSIDKEDWTLKGLIPLELNGSHVLETNVAEDSSPLEHDIDADYPEGAAVKSNGGIWERTSVNPDTKVVPGRIIGSWIYSQSLQYSTYSYFWNIYSKPAKSQYFQRSLTSAEKGGDNNLLYARWQAINTLAANTPFPAIETSDSNWLWVEKAASRYHYVPLWVPSSGYSAGDVRWQPALNGSLYSGFGFIALENIIFDPLNPYINEPKKLDDDEELTGAEWTFKEADNQYRLFNYSPYSVTTNPDEIYYKFLITESFTSMVIANADASEVEITSTDILETESSLFEHTEIMKKGSAGDYQYWFEQNRSKRDLVIEGIPRRQNSILTIRIKNPGAQASVGGIYIGVFNDLGWLTSVGAGALGFTRENNGQYEASAALNKFSHTVQIPVEKFNQIRVRYKNIIAAGAAGIPTFFKATSHLTESHGLAFLDDHITITKNDGQGQAYDRLELREVY